MIRLLPFLLLASCAPFQIAGTNKHGHAYAVQSGGFWHKAEGYVLEAEHGAIKLKQVVDKPDGVAGPQGMIDGWVTRGLASLLKDERVNANNNETSVLLKKEDTAQIPLKGAADVGIINANAAAAEAAKP